MTIEIGYIPDPSSPLSIALSHDPVYHPIREQNPEPETLGRCPAVVDYVLSAFNVHVPYDFSFTLSRRDNGEVSVHYHSEKTTLSAEYLHRSLQLTHATNGVIQVLIHPFWTFISDTPEVYVEQTSAYEQTNPEPIRGKFDCFKWIRPLSYGIKVEFDKEVVITKDSPIYQVKFHHPREKRFVLKECVITPEIINQLAGSSLRSMNKSTNWSKIFEFSGRRRPKSLVRFSENGNEV